MHVLRMISTKPSHIWSQCARGQVLFIFFYYCSVYLYWGRSVIWLSLIGLGTNPVQFSAHSLNKQMLVSAHLLVVVSLYEEPLPKRKSSSSHKQITFPYHYLEKETDVKYDFDNWLAVVVRLFILSKPQNMLLGSSCRKFIQNFCISSMHKPQMKCATPTYCKMVRISPKTCVILREWKKKRL